MERSSHLEVVDPRENIAKLVYERWLRYNYDRRPWLERGLEARRYLTAADTNATEVGSLPWKNKTTIPKLTQIADGLQSYYMAAFFPADDWFIWESLTPSYDPTADLIEKYMRVKLQLSGFQNEMEKIVKDWITYGTCFGGVEWVNETFTNPEDGNTVVRYVGPRVFRISPVDCTIDPRASSFNNSPFIYRSVVSIVDLMDHNARSSQKYEEAALAEVIKYRKGPQRQQFTDFYKEHGLEIDGFQTIEGYLDSGYVDIVEFWGDLWDSATGEIMRNRVITVADGAVVLRNVPNPAWTGLRPISMATWRILPDNLYGQGPLDNLVGMQYRCDHLENLKADAFDQIIHPVVVIKGDSGEDYQWGPGAKWYVPENGDVTILPPNASVLQCDNQIALYHNYMEQIAGVPREAMGFRTPGEKTAFEMSVLQQGADRQFIDKVRHFETQMIQPLLNIMFEMCIRNLDPADLVRTFKNSVDASPLLDLTMEDVIASGSIRPIGAKHYEARNKRIQELRVLIEMAATTSIGPHISGVNAARMLSEELGWDKYGIVAPNVAIREQLMAQMEAEQMKQQMTEMMGPGPMDEMEEDIEAEGEPLPIA